MTPAAAVNSTLISQGWSMASNVTMLLTAQTHITRQMPTKHTRLTIVRLLIGLALRSGADVEPAVDLRVVAGDPDGDLEDELLQPVDEEAHLGATLGDLTEDGVDLLHLAVDGGEVGVEH